ncbi:MAG: hypothetical protein JKY54_07405 [Flavobacteriales bacterium]|nr:hypothetical protein [Flavobacteriales bacterium]
MMIPIVEELNAGCNAIAGGFNAAIKERNLDVSTFKITNLLAVFQSNVKLVPAYLKEQKAVTKAEKKAAKKSVKEAAKRSSERAEKMASDRAERLATRSETK